MSIDFNEMKEKKKVNFVMITGNICFEPEIKTVGQGLVIMQLTIAYNAKSGADSQFYRVKIFGEKAKANEGKLIKGDYIKVTGYLDYYKKDSRDYISIVANDVDFISRSQKNGGKPLEVSEEVPF